MGNFGNMLMGSAAGAVDSAIGMGMGLLLEKHNDKRQIRQQQKLSEQELQFAQRMGDYNYGKQMEMWKATNYGAQRKELEAAGLNPGLLYGMGGAGGATTGNASQSIKGGSGAPAGGGEIMGMMMNKMQMKMMEAQIENVKADTNKKNAEVPNIETDTISKGIVNEINQMALELNGETYEARKMAIKYETNKALQEMQIAQNSATVSENTVMDRIAIIGAELVSLEVRNELTRAQKDKTFSDIEVNKQAIQNFITQNAQGWMRLSQEERNVKVNEKLAEFNTSLSREAAGAIGGIITTIISRGMSKPQTVINKIERASHRLGDHRFKK